MEPGRLLERPLHAALRVEELPGCFAEREKTGQWKYLAEWIALVRRVHLHHELPRPGTKPPRSDILGAKEKPMRAEE